MSRRARPKREPEQFRAPPPPGFEYVRGVQAQQAIAWLNTARRGMGFTPAGLAGRGFAAYVRIDYPVIEELIDPKDLLSHYREQHPYSNVPNQQTQHEQILGRLLMGATDAPFPFRRIRLHELAHRIGIPYSAHLYMDLVPHRQTLDRRSYLLPLGFHEAWTMPRATATRLVKLLQPFTCDQFCYYDWEQTRYIPFLPWPWTPSKDGRIILRAGLEDAPSTILISAELAQNHIPDLWWPESRNWVLSSDYEHCSFAVVAGPRRLIDSILADPNLDAIEVEPAQELSGAFEAWTRATTRAWNREQ